MLRQPALHTLGSTIMLPNLGAYGFVPSSKVGPSYLRLVFGANTLFFT
jgi:hypothetical protein